MSSNNKLRLVKMLDGLNILKEIDLDLEFQKEYKLSLKVKKNNLQGYLDKKLFLEFNDIDSPLNSGGIGFVVESGTQFTDEIIIG